MVTPAELRAALPRTWDALFARHGSPRPIQLLAARPLLAGRDVLLVAPTASGKTEAYVAPLVERHVRDEAPRLLVVSPTRALANDLHRRLAGPLGRAGVALGRWTGEHHDGGALQAVTVLTPEALDARLSRSPAAVANVRALVLDEVHVLDGSARGDQVRVLVARLRHLAEGLQVVAASATVPDPGALAERYLRDGVVVATGERRGLRAKVVVVEGAAQVRAALDEMVRGGFRKVLLFENSRQDAEELAGELRGTPPFGEAVFTHHGSLARGARLSVEARLLAAPVGLCVATSTLELGIDIGDIDLVALHGLPADLPSLLQRVGRGGRREGAAHTLALARGRFEASAFRTLLRAQAEGAWFPTPDGFRAGVLVQQALSVLHERRSRTVDAGALRRRLPPDLQAAWTEARLDAVLVEAARHELLEPTGGAFALGPKGEAAWRTGKGHANIGASAGVLVHDAMTGEAVGEVEALDGGSFALGGRSRQVVLTEGRRAVTASGGAGGIARFARGARAPVGAAFATAILRDAGIPAPCRARVAGEPWVFHGLGTAGGELLAAALRRAKVKLGHVGRLAVQLTEAWPERWPTAEAADTALGLRHRKLGRLLAMGAWHAHLPDAEQKAAVAPFVELEKVRALLAAGPPPLVECEDPELWIEAAHG